MQRHINAPLAQGIGFGLLEYCGHFLFRVIPKECLVGQPTIKVFKKKRPRYVWFTNFFSDAQPSESIVQILGQPYFELSVRLRELREIGKVPWLRCPSRLLKYLTPRSTPAPTQTL